MIQQREGRARRLGATRMESLGWALLVIAGIGLCYLLFYTLPRERALYGAGSATATGVVSKKITDSRGRPIDYGAFFQFRARNGEFHTVKNYYDGDLWDKVHEGDWIQVRYVTFDPKYAYDVRLLETRRSGLARVAVPMGIFLIVGAAGVLFLVGIGRLPRRQAAPAAAR